MGKREVRDVARFIIITRNVFYMSDIRLLIKIKLLSCRVEILN